jgi:hypothetical protein
MHDARINGNATSDPGCTFALGPIDGWGGLVECRGEIAGLRRPISSRISSSPMIFAAIAVALLLACVWAPWAPLVRTVNSSHSGPFSPKRNVHGLLGSLLRQLSPNTSG